jgi:hypothetical protein
MCAGIDRFNINGATGLKENAVARIAESADEGEAIRLNKRFPSCDLHKGAPIVQHLCQDLIDRALFPSIEGIVCIAPGTAKWASG